MVDKKYSCSTMKQCTAYIDMKNSMLNNKLNIWSTRNSLVVQQNGQGNAYIKHGKIIVERYVLLY